MSHRAKIATKKACRGEKVLGLSEQQNQKFVCFSPGISMFFIDTPPAPPCQDLGQSTDVFAQDQNGPLSPPCAMPPGWDDCARISAP